MGNVWKNSIVKREEVEKSISKINEFTKTYTLMDLTGLYLTFSIDESVLFSNKIIKVIVYKFNSQKGIVVDQEKIVRLTIDEFYNYYNALMNSLSIFYETKLEMKLKDLGEKDFDNDESSLCPICEERKVEISLPCSHFFCEQCIKQWVIKSESCPLCRCKLKHSQKEEKETPAGIEGTDRWSLLSNDNNINQEIRKDSIDIFLKLTDLFFIADK